MTVTAENLVNREVHYCVSSLVATLASEGLPHSMGDLAALTEQAQELCYPVEDFEEAARQSGWKQHPAHNGAWSRDDHDTIGPNGEIDMLGAASAQEACELDDIEPYQREVFEHWIVSDWLAGKLIEHGEKVDKDFAGMTVWARTTTGQGIASDSVIEAIVAELNK